MVSDQEIANGVENLLRQANPNTFTSINGVVQQLEAKLGLDLSHKAGFIRDQIDFLLRSHIRTSNPRPPPPKDHFTLQHLPQFHPNHPQFSPQFGFPQHHPQQLNFRYPPPQNHPNPNPNQNPNLYQYSNQQARKPDNALASNVALPAAGAVEMPKESAPTGTKRRGGPGGLNKVCGVSLELQAIVGEPALPRTQIVKQLWAYIRKNNLQDPSNKRKIICDEPLRLVFETDCTDMFKMNKLLAKHIIALEPRKEPGSNSKRLKVEAETGSDSKQLKVEVEAATENTEASAKASPSTMAISDALACFFGAGAGSDSKQLKEEFEAATENTEASTEASPSTMVISDALASFFGTGEREMLQSEAVRRVWEYVRVNNLTDPNNSMMVICDLKLQELFGCERTSVLGISEMLISHFFKKS